MGHKDRIEEEYINETMDALCSIVSNILNSGNLNNIENKQKMYATASFLEFIKAGADVTTETKNSNTVAFIINMK